MTLILSLLTPRFVLQASDRRLVFPPKGALAEDQRNKALFFCGHTAWSYTGLARIGRNAIPTDDWMSDVMVKASSLQDAVGRLKTEGAIELRRMMWPSHFTAHDRDVIRRLAFVGVGFADQRMEGSSVIDVPSFPFLTVVSNFFDDRRGWLPVAEREFRQSGCTLGERMPFMLFQAPSQMSRNQLVKLDRMVRRCVKAQASPYAFARLLCRAIRDVHDAGNASVGRNVMCTIVTEQGLADSNPSHRGGSWPLNPGAKEPDYFRHATGDDPFEVGLAYIYLPGSPDDRIHYGPSSCCVGRQFRGTVMQPVVAAGDRTWRLSAETRRVDRD